MNRVANMLHLGEVHAAGYTGQGVTAVVLDTGIGRNPVIPASRIIKFLDFVNGREGAYDDSGHGTHVTGILAGNGRTAGIPFMGIAPECSLIGIKVLNEKGDGNLDAVIRGLAWVTEHHNEYRIRVVNLSFGAGEEEQQEKYNRLNEWIEEVWNAGICVVCSAGNKGPKRGSITVPGNNRNVITVGASNGIRDYKYSGCGPTKECVVKPDLVAPAVRVWSTAVVGNRQWNRESPRLFSYKSGTSMATPMVSGAVCLLLQKEGSLSPKEVKQRLWDTSDSLGFPIEQQGSGMLNLRRLLSI